MNIRLCTSWFTLNFNCREYSFWHNLFPHSCWTFCLLSFSIERILHKQTKLSRRQNSLKVYELWMATVRCVINIIVKTKHSMKQSTDYSILKISHESCSDLFWIKSSICVDMYLRAKYYEHFNKILIFLGNIHDSCGMMREFWCGFKLQ